MKRSTINAAIDQARDLFAAHRVALPPFAAFSPDDWRRRDKDAIREIPDVGLGWDVTDFGGGDFLRTGLLLFTVRNGRTGSSRYAKPYAEKIMIARAGQITPMHFHWHKMEDIINRGGGNLLIRLYNATADERLADTPVEVSVDGTLRRFDAGGCLCLRPGESVTLPPRLYHSFWGEPGEEDVLVGEVSMVNDDDGDNRFLEPLGRFSKIEEDEPARYVLCNEYAKVVS